MKNLKATLTIFFIHGFFLLFAQVNLPTGAAEFSIPIMSYGDQNNLSLNVSINYNAGNGLLVNTVASEVGTGWQLNAGGYILRKQRGLPDDQKRNMPIIVQDPLPSNTWVNSTQYAQTHYPNGFIYSVFSPTDNLTNEVAYVRMNGTNWDGTWAGEIPNEAAEADRQQDIFTISIESQVVDFVIDKNLNQIRCLDNNKFKIEAVIEDMYSSGVKTTIGKFIVTTDKGIKYIFDAKEFSEEIIYNKNININGYFNPYPDESSTNFNPGYVFVPAGQAPPANSQVAVSMGRTTGAYVVTKWFLSEIVNPANGKKIIFTYENYELRRNTNRSLSYFKGLSMSIGREVLQTKRLTKVELPDMSELIFVYDPTLRVDVPNKPIKEVVQKRNNQLQSKTVFNYEYFYCSSLVPYNYSFETEKKFMARLCLKSIQKFGAIAAAEPPYIFEYNMGTAGPTAMNNWSEGKIYNGPKDIVPPNFSIFTDHWGYYNSSTLHPRGSNTFKESDVIAFTSYSSEATQATIHKQAIEGVAKNGILKSVQYPFGGVLNFEYEQNKALFNNQNVNSGGVRVFKTIMYDGIDHSRDLIKEYRYLKEDNVTSSGWGVENYTYQRNISNRIYASALGKTPVATKGFAGSLISSTFKETIFNIGAFQYNGNAQLGIDIYSIASSIIMNIVMHIILELFNNPPDYIDETDILHSTESFESKNPLPRLYSRVEVVDKIGAGSPNGSTIYEFNSPADLPITIPVLQIPYSSQPRITRGFYGLLKNVKIKDVTGNIIKENINEYEIVSDNNNSVLNKSWYTSGYMYDRYPQAFVADIKLNSNRITQTTWNIPSNFVVLKKSKEFLYKPGFTGSVLKTQELTYSPNYQYIRSTKSMDSKGNILESKNYYPSDYNLSSFPVLNAMASANFKDVVISQEMWRTKPNATPELISIAVNEYGQLSNGNYLPVKTYGFESDAPLAESIIGTFNSNSLIRNSTYIKPKTEISYHANNWPSETKSIEADSYTSFLYGYNNSFKIAEISNARISEVAYNSFEESTSAGGWLVSGASISQEISPTGAQCLQLSGGSSINTPIPINKNYILSFWATGPVNISGSPTLITDKPTINGWTYYEYKINSGSATPVITGSVKIDELRLYPENARLITTTYNINGLATSICDVNNRISYKSYDQAGRIDKEFDEYRNIIKTYEYRYKDFQ